MLRSITNEGPKLGESGRGGGSGQSSSSAGRKEAPVVAPDGGHDAAKPSADAASVDRAPPRIPVAPRPNPVPVAAITPRLLAKSPFNEPPLGHTAPIDPRPPPSPPPPSPVALLLCLPSTEVSGKTPLRDVDGDGNSAPKGVVSVSGGGGGEPRVGGSGIEAEDVLLVSGFSLEVDAEEKQAALFFFDLTGLSAVSGNAADRGWTSSSSRRRTTVKSGKDWMVYG